MSLLQPTVGAFKANRQLPTDPLLVPAPAGIANEIATYPRAAGVTAQTVPHLLDQSMAISGYSAANVGVWRPQDDHYDLGTIPNQSTLLYYFNGDDVDADGSYNRQYQPVTYSNPLTNGATFYYPAVMNNGWANSPLASGGSATGGGGTTPNPVTGETSSANWWQNAVVMPNNINGHSAVRTPSNSAQALDLIGSASVLNIVHNAASFEMIAVARCNYDQAVGSGTSPFYVSQVLACTAQGGVNGAGFGFYNGLWMFYISTTAGVVCNGYSGPAYKAGDMAIYGVFGNGTNCYSYVNNGAQSTFSVTTGHLGSTISNPASVNDWSIGYDQSGAYRAYPTDIAAILVWSAPFSTPTARNQMINQLNRVYHIF